MWRAAFNDRIAGFAVELYRHALCADSAAIEATLVRGHASVRCTLQRAIDVPVFLRSPWGR